MIDIEQVIKDVSKNLNEDEKTVAIVCKSIFKVIEKIMKDDEDTRDILLNHLMKFKLKRRFKENKTQKYTAK